VKLAPSHWESKPQRIASVMRVEDLRVVRLLGGRVVNSEVQNVVVREVWKDGPCRHVVLLVSTRRRLPIQCPDCQPPRGVA